MSFNFFFSHQSNLFLQRLKVLIFSFKDLMLIILLSVEYIGNENGGWVTNWTRFDSNMMLPILFYVYFCLIYWARVILVLRSDHDCSSTLLTLTLFRFKFKTQSFLNPKSSLQLKPETKVKSRRTEVVSKYLGILEKIIVIINLGTISLSF